jgi:hypothetical protein
MCQDQATYSMGASFFGDLERRRVAADTTCEQDRP